MSYYDDEIAPYIGEFEDYAERLIEDSNNGYRVWRTKNGNSINVSDMSESHLKSCIRKIRSEKWRLEWLEPLEKELNCRQDSDFLCEDYFEQG